MDRHGRHFALGLNTPEPQPSAEQGAPDDPLHEASPLCGADPLAAPLHRRELRLPGVTLSVAACH